MAKRVLFAVISPLGYRVILTRNRWREITRFKHPALVGLEQDLRQCLRDPKVIRVSNKDGDTHLYYRENEKGYLCVVVGVSDDEEDRFIVTAYFTKDLKKGDELWTR